MSARRTTARTRVGGRQRSPSDWDVIIVGAGPAGSSAALWLGRCRRRVLVVDADQPRNAASPALHGYLTRDGVPPRKLRALGHAEAARYPSVQFVTASVRQIRRRPRNFAVSTADGRQWNARLLLLATGRRDTVPRAPGFKRFYGRGVFHCTYCDGWEHRDQPVAVYGNDSHARATAKLLTTWSDDVTVLTDGRKPSPSLRGFKVAHARIKRLKGDREGTLAGIRFADGTDRACRAIFFCSDCVQKSNLPGKLGCEFDATGAVKCRQHSARGVPGLYVAGNVRNGVHLAITAAAEGAEAALLMNDVLVRETPRASRMAAAPASNGSGSRAPKHRA